MKDRLAVAKRKVVREGQSGGLRRAGAEVLYLGNKPQGPVVLHRDILQYPVINHNGKEYEKEYIYGTYTCIYMKPPSRTAESNTTL